MIDNLTPLELAGEAMGLIALGFCLAAFADKRDDRLILLMIFGNIAFSAQFLLFGNWVAGAITALIVVRVALVRRFKGDVRIMGALLAATVAVAWATWTGPWDWVPVLATFAGTSGMFLLAGIPMRLCLAFAAICWIVTNLVNGSLGALAAEALILITNLVTIARMTRDERRAENPTA